MQKYHGTGVAVITPFNNDLSIDFDALEKIIENLIRNNTDYLVALGTTSEAPTLTHDEKSRLLDIFTEISNKRLPVIAGSGGNNTKEAIQFIKSAESRVDGFLSVCPYYNKPSQKAMYRHFETISKSTELDIILYNVPSRTGVNLLPETTAALARNFSNIAALKDAAGSLMQTMQSIAVVPDHFSVLSGDDALAVAQIAAGAKGLISVSANAIPYQISNMINAALSNDLESARKTLYQYHQLHQLIFEEGNPTGIKCFMSKLELCKNVLRLPLITASPQLEESLEKIARENLVAA